MIHPLIHIALHIIIPGIVARYLFPDRWRMVWLIMLLTMFIDADHLFVDPIFDPNRCSIGFHPLHSYPAIAAYLVLATLAKTRVVGLGLLIHIALDWLDCIWMV